MNRKRLLPRLVGLAALAVTSAFALAPAAFAAPSATANPNTGLQDLQQIEVQGSGFTPNTVIAVLLCTADAIGPQDCEGSTRDDSIATDAQGNYYNPAYTMLVLPNPLFGGISSINCDANNPCKLYVGENFNDFSAPKAFVPITFGGEIVPETSYLPLLPIGGLVALGGGAFVIWRKRRQDAPVAA